MTELTASKSYSPLGKQQHIAMNAAGFNCTIKDCKEDDVNSHPIKFPMRFAFIRI